MVTVFGFELAAIIVLVGLVLMALEAVAPGANLIVIGIAMMGAGLVGLLEPSLATPIAQAGLILLFGAVTLYGYQRLDLYGGKGREQTSDSASLIGQTGFVTERVTETDGEIKLENGGFDPHFRCRSTGAPIPEGTRARVVDPGGGNVLIVEPVETDRTTASTEGES